MAQKTSRSRAKREEADIDRAYRKVSGGKYQKKKSKREKKRAAIATTCFSAAILVALIAGAIFLYQADQDRIIADNVTVAGVNVGGMTQEEAIAAVTAATNETYPKQAMSVTVLDTTIQIAPSVAEVSLNVRSAVRAALRHGKSGDVVDVTSYLKVNENAIKDALNGLGEKYSHTLSQSTYEVTGSAPEQVLVVHLGIPEYGLDMDALYQQVLTAYAKNTFTVTGVCDLVEPTAIDLQKILDQYYIAPIDACFDKETYEVIEGTPGYGFDIDKAKQTLESAKYGSTVEIAFTEIPPAITSQTLQEVLYRDTLATFTATAESESGRNTNLRLACEAINGMVINPGQVFSYNNALGERTPGKGYKPGPSYLNGEEIQTIGGGICQVSSCLYNCAMLADLDIRTRENHGYATEYVRLGMDAAVSWGSLDFCFANNTNYPIRIEASADGGTTTVTLLGTDEKDYYVEMEYEVLATYAYETTYKTLSANNPEGYKNGEYIIAPHTGYSIQTYRCKYDKQTKELLSREEEAASYYEKCNAVICVISGNSGTPSQGIGNGSVTEADGLLP